MQDKERGSYVRDHPTTPSDANTEITVRMRGTTPELVVVARTRIPKGKEAYRNYGLDHYLHEMKNKKLRSKLLDKYAPLLPAAQRLDWVTKWLEERAHIPTTPLRSYWYDERGRHTEGARDTET